MKRKVSIILACLLVAIMALGLCACGESGNGGGEKETTAAVETKAPVEKETTAPVETVAPVSPATDSNIPANPLVSDDSHLVIEQDGILLSYEFKGDEIVGLIAYYDMGDETMAALMETLTEEEIAQIGQEDGMDLLDIFPYKNYAGYVLGPSGWEGLTLADLKAAVELGVLTEAK